MRKPGREIADLPALVRARAGEHDAFYPAARWSATIGAPQGDEGVLRVLRAKLAAVVEHDAIGGGMRGEDRDRRGDSPAVAAQASIGIGGPAPWPAGVLAVRDAQQMVGRLRA